MERTKRFLRVEVMKIVYVALIAVSAVFNSFTQSFAYDAWQSGIPIDALVESKGDPTQALFNLSLKELGEVKCS